MTMQELTNFLDKKIEENKNFIKITFYELRVECNLTQEETEDFLKLAKIRFENMRYKVYLMNEEYIYQNERMIVKPNELIIAIK